MWLLIAEFNYVFHSLKLLQNSLFDITVTDKHMKANFCAMKFNHFEMFSSKRN